MADAIALTVTIRILCGAILIGISRTVFLSSSQVLMDPMGNPLRPNQVRAWMEGDMW